MNPSPEIFTPAFWIIFAVGVVVALIVSTIYGRRAIHPRLRPHFGFVVIVFLVLVLVAFFTAIVLGRIATGGVRQPPPKFAPPAEAR